MFEIDQLKKDLTEMLDQAKANISDSDENLKVFKDSMKSKMQEYINDFADKFNAELSTTVECKQKIEHTLNLIDEKCSQVTKVLETSEKTHVIKNSDDLKSDLVAFLDTSKHLKVGDVVNSVDVQSCIMPSLTQKR